MNWLTDITPPGIKKMFRHQDDGQDTLWTRCSACGQMTFNRDLEHEQMVCPNCGHHMRIDPVTRLNHLLGNNWERVALPETRDDPLKFKDSKPYAARLRDARKKTGEQDALIVGKGRLGGQRVVVAVQNFAFLGGSMGTALGEALIKAAQEAVNDGAAMIAVTASGGARMQEGLLSLMQMPRSTLAVQMVQEAGLPYIVVLTHPTTGGVTASYAMLGDIHIAEPGALIGFAGPRVIEQTIREKLPENFQRAEYLRAKGMVDRVTDRREIGREISAILSVLMPPAEAQDDADQPGSGEAEDAGPKAANDQPAAVDDLPKAAE